MLGEMDDGGLAMRLPVDGLTIGIALLRDRSADGWRIFKFWLWLRDIGGGMKEDVAALVMDKAGVTCGCI